MSLIRVGVLRGGISSEYNISLATGKTILEELPKEKYKAIDILLSKDGVWHMQGIPATKEKLTQSVDIIFNALHGYYGEDGKVQQFLETLNIPYTGSEAFPSSLGMNRKLSKQKFRQTGIKTLRHEHIPHYENKILPELVDQYIENAVKKSIANVPLPWTLKSIHGNTSLDTVIVYDFSELKTEIENFFKKYSFDLLIEETISGRVVSSGVIENFRGEKKYVLLPIDHANPAHSRFSDSEKKQIEKLSKDLHDIIGFSHSSQSHFLITPKGVVYALQANSLPHFGADAIFSKSINAIGESVPHFLDHIISLALQQK